MSAQNSRPRGVFPAIVGFVGFSALAGLLVAVMMTPALAATSVAASSTINVFNSLPDFIEIGATPQQNQIFAVNGKNADGSPKYKQIATVYGNQNREELTWDQVPQMVKDVTLAAEDKRFYDHGGIDPQGLLRAAASNVGSGTTQGGSTLSQQLVKNLCVVAALTKYSTAAENDLFVKAANLCKEGTLDRKIREMKNAISLEKRYTKDQILLAYLNIASFGGTVYGIQSAAQRYYNVDAKDLTLAQAASLLAIVQEPEKRRLDVPANYADDTIRRDHILNEMLDSGWATQADFDKAIATKVDATTVNVQPPKNGCLAADQYAKQFCDYIVESVKDFAALGANEADRLNSWKLGGYKVYTTLDLKLQKVSQDTVRKYAPNTEKRFQLGASAISIEPGTGYIRTMAQNKVFDNRSKENGGGADSTSAINFNTSRDYGGSGGFQPGSGYKVFTLLNWLEQGHGLNERLDATPAQTPLSDFTNSCGPTGPSSQTYHPRNDSGERGYFTVRNATAQSVNGVFVQMALQLDLCRTKEIALAFGIRLAAPLRDDPTTKNVNEAQQDTDLYSGPSSILGVDAIAPLNIAAAYAGVANHGIYCKPIAVMSFTDSSGKVLPGPTPDCAAAIDPDVAAAAQSALATGADRYAANPHDGTPLIGKTGTTNASQQTWVTISSTALTTTVWVGNIVGKFPLRSYSANGVAGGNIRHVIAKAILTAADKTYKGHAFDVAPQRLLTGTNVAVGTYLGMPEADAEAAIKAAGFEYSNEGTIASAGPKGTVAKQSPDPGTSISGGAKIQVWLSDGSKGVVPDVTSVPQNADQATAAIVAAGFANVAQACVATPIGGTIDPATGLPNPALPNYFEGQVVGISPAAGKEIDSTKTITIQVAHAAC